MYEPEDRDAVLAAADALETVVKICDNGDPDVYKGFHATGSLEQIKQLISILEKNEK